jgi:hypothetical protein
MRWWPTFRASRATAITGTGRLGSKPYLVIDTGGFEPLAKDGIMHQMARQTEQAIDEADVVISCRRWPQRRHRARQGDRQPAAQVGSARSGGGQQGGRS